MCDHVNKEYRKEYGDYSDMFAKLFPEFEWMIYDVYNGEFPTNYDECDVYFATGSKHSVYDDIDWIQGLKKVIKGLYNEKKYFIGFCFGHQLIGESLGGKVEKSPNGWCVGVHDFKVYEREPWITPFQEDFSLLMMCQDQILTLPVNTKVIAGSEMCPFAMIKVGETFLGIQSHPEFSKSYDGLLMKTRMNRMGDDVANAGLKSLLKDIHTKVIRSWILKFINGI